MPKKSKKTKEEIIETVSEEVKKEENSKKISQAEFEKKVIELAEKGITSEKIGEQLRKQGIHPKEYSKKVSQILKEKKIYVSPDIKNIKTKLEQLNKHCGVHKHDKRAIREKERIFSQIRKLEMYFKKREVAIKK